MKLLPLSEQMKRKRRRPQRETLLAFLPAELCPDLVRRLADTVPGVVIASELPEPDILATVARRRPHGVASAERSAVATNHKPGSADIATAGQQ